MFRTKKEYIIRKIKLIFVIIITRGESNVIICDKKQGLNEFI